MSIMQKKILLVDDQPQNLHQVLKALYPKKEEYELSFAPNGAQALALLEDLKVDLILLDWEMPLMDGIQTLEALKKEERWANIPVIMYTGVHTASQALQKAFDLGAIDFLRKPVDETELLARIQNIFYIQQTHALEQERNELALSLKRKELLHYAIWLQEKNGFLQSFEQKLSSYLQKKLPYDKEGQSLLRELEQEIAIKSKWENLRQQADNIHQAFIRRFEESHPQLSAGDIKLATLIRIKQTNQEIADTLAIALSSVSKKKLRLRDKLGFASAAELEAHILTF